MASMGAGGKVCLAKSLELLVRDTLDGDATGKGTSGSNREAESTNAPARGGLLRSSVEAG